MLWWLRQEIEKFNISVYDAGKQFVVNLLKNYLMILKIFLKEKLIG